MDQGDEPQADTTVPLVVYHEDRRIVIGTATVDTKIMKAKAHIQQQRQPLREIVGTVFQFGSGRNVELPAKGEN